MTRNMMRSRTAAAVYAQRATAHGVAIIGVGRGGEGGEGVETYSSRVVMETTRLWLDGS